ncbi:3-hydroxyacyl-CoA dehydrogenase [Rhodanobacter thiooxydans]|uniref:enoyl-CoA hydratase n=1 Tax=Rhodanobacter thiooxydans TaxID=416169 RepID=A0A154QF29_9GAMM|nr:3-hydroxyacyl-CoA dehydrogenase NAD-binding domain-containing protein [Rhodanobacter thiooxydans]EIM03100.1 3-hydroxyacyl-CoA dehydrogenase [Rhodanobacter thiooxydans LCS2]KZC22872.1 3-hydroxyacyl-CoA dehydrogenase [Rhodanobacter thiooxydans]MCW0200713.1 3-hydroxyacyl-CoA dehydrogenase NAD-binding domain-containing protein [Rhodanobacter thiooxydans]
MTANNPVTLEIDAAGIGLVTFDQPGRAMNVLNPDLVAPFAAIVERLEKEEAIKGLVLTSGKSTFIVGADIDQLTAISTAEEAFSLCEDLKALLRRIEKCGKPVVAALNGTALGGGLEVALACHARFALDEAALKLGLPEVKLGLLPGGGGTQRLPRMIGIQKSFELLTQGTELRAAEARGLGLVNDLAASREELLQKSRAWCVANPRPVQPWDKQGFRIPGGDSKHPGVVQLLAIAPSIANAKAHGNYPAIGHIMSCLFEGCLLDFDAACQVESRYFAACVVSQESRNMIGTLWHQLNAIKKGQSRPAGVAPSRVRKVGILGAGMMGAGIAYVSAKAGIEVILLDTTIENAEKGKAYSQGLLDKAISRGRSTPDKRDALLAKITPTTRYEDLQGCDLVIEAVFEDRAIKAACTQKAEAVIAADAVFASNTSTLPITGLAKASVRPKNFIGLHFFSPVDKMPLVEIIVGEQTSNETLARGFDYVLQIGKTPIVVNDSRGFYTSRVFATYVMEGLAMLGEGVHPRSIEAAGIKAGMPMPPLALQDEVSLSLSLHVADQTRKDLAAEGKPLPEHPGEPVLRLIGGTHQRLGKKTGKGLYDYDGRDKHLWPELTRLYPTAAEQPTQQELVDRLMFVQANEAARCFEENVVRSVADANIGSIFGWGFAPFHGGALQFINAMGAAGFVARSRELTERYGARFAPADIVVKQAAAGGRFEGAA